MPPIQTFFDSTGFSLALATIESALPPPRSEAVQLALTTMRAALESGKTATADEEDILRTYSQFMGVTVSRKRQRTDTLTESGEVVRLLEDVRGKIDTTLCHLKTTPPTTRWKLPHTLLEFHRTTSSRDIAGYIALLQGAGSMTLLSFLRSMSGASVSASASSSTGATLSAILSPIEPFNDVADTAKTALSLREPGSAIDDSYIRSAFRQFEISGPTKLLQATEINPDIRLPGAPVALLKPYRETSERYRSFVRDEAMGDGPSAGIVAMSEIWTTPASEAVLGVLASIYGQQDIYLHARWAASASREWNALAQADILALAGTLAALSPRPKFILLPFDIQGVVHTVLIRCGEEPKFEVFGEMSSTLTMTVTSALGSALFPGARWTTGNHQGLPRPPFPHRIVSTLLGLATYHRVVHHVASKDGDSDSGGLEAIWHSLNELAYSEPCAWKVLHAYLIKHNFGILERGVKIARDVDEGLAGSEVMRAGALGSGSR